MLVFLTVCDKWGATTIKMRSNPAYAENGFVLTQWSNVCVALRRQQVKSSKPVLSLSPGIRISC